MSLSLFARSTPISLGSWITRRPASTKLIRIYRWVDVAVALGVLFCVLMLTNLRSMPGGIEEFLAMRVTVKNLLLLGAFTFVWPQVCASVGLYKQQRFSSRRDEIIRIVSACTIGSSLALIFPLTSTRGDFRFSAVAYFWSGAIIVSVSGRYLIQTFYWASRRRKIRHVIIVGSGPRAYRLYQEISANPQAGYSLLGFIDSHSNGVTPEEIKRRKLGSIEQLEEILVNNVVDEVLIALPIKSCYSDIQNSIRVCEKVGIESKYLSDVFQSTVAKPRHEEAERFPVVAMKVVSDGHCVAVKRAIDIIGSVLCLIILSPIILLTALAIKLTSKGPVIFSQERYGLNKRRFKMYKFRSMVMDAEVRQSSLESMNEARGPVFKIKDDPRVTKVGRFLRKTSIDELPQLVNVLRGDMSLVGPRPLPKRDVSRFSEGWLMRRFSVRPGITGLWQIRGRSNVAFDRWIELDLKYIDEWTLGLDLKILIRTLPVVLKGTGAA